MLNKYEELKGAKAAIYKRKSQEDDERQVLSLGKQAEICNEIVAEYQFDTLSAYQFEEQKSAKVAGLRPEFSRMIKLIRTGPVDVVVAWTFNRFVRNMQEGGLLIDLLHTGYLKAIVTKEKIFFPNDNTIIIAIEAASATEYSRDLSRSVKEGIDRKAALHVPHGIAPIGYLNNKHKRQGERDWSDDPDRLPLLRQVMERLLTGQHSAHSVWKWARQDLKLTTPARRKTGGTLLSRASFYRMLQRTEYAGFFYRNGDRIELRCITPIITEDEYWQIQDFLGREGVPRPKKEIAPYSQYVLSPLGEYCGADRTFRVTCDCSHTFSGQRKKECPKCGVPLDRIEHPRYYTARHYYNVARKKRKEPCKYLNETKIDSFLHNYARTYLAMPAEFQGWSQAYLNELKTKEEQQLTEQSKSNTDYLRSLDQQAKNANRALLAGALEPNEYTEALREIRARKEKAQHVQTTADWFDKSYSLISYSDKIIDTWKEGSVSKKRSVLAEIGSNFVWDENKISINNPKWLDAFINGLNDAKAKKDRFELIDDANTTSDNNANFEKSSKSDAAFLAVCGMWDDVRTALLEEEPPLE